MRAAACLLGAAWPIVDDHAAPGGRWGRALLLRALQLGADRAQLVQEQPWVGALLVKVRAGEEARGVLQWVVNLSRRVELFYYQRNLPLRGGRCPYRRVFPHPEKFNYRTLPKDNKVFLVLLLLFHMVNI